jgi:hypothetical protein
MIEGITFLIIIIAGALFALSRKFTKARVRNNNKSKTVQQETDELITVILPTINHDK